MECESKLFFSSYRIHDKLVNQHIATSLYCLQASVYVSSLLFALCQDIAKIGGHSLERYTNTSDITSFRTLDLLCMKSVVNAVYTSCLILAWCVKPVNVSVCVCVFV